MAGGETQGFRIKPDELLAVAQRVQALLDDVSGANGGVAGNFRTFQSEAQTTNVQNALNSLFPHMPPGAAYVEAYGLEYDGMSTKYQAIVGHLTELEAACRTTAEQYGASDERTRSDISQVDPGTTVPANVEGL